jgi:hypothetical protein
VSADDEVEMMLANTQHSTSAHKNLRKLATGGAVATAETTAGQSSTECTICLSSIAVSHLQLPLTSPDSRLIIDSHAKHYS